MAAVGEAIVKQEGLALRCFFKYRSNSCSLRIYRVQADDKFHMEQPSSLTKITELRERLLPQVRAPIQFPEPSLRLNLEARQGSQTRPFKHIHQSCLFHTENFRATNEIKHLYLLDAYIGMTKSENPLGIYMVARSMLEFNAFIHEVLIRLREASALASRQWLDGGRKFFGIIVRARYATSRQEYKARLSADGVAEDLQKPMNIKHCLNDLSGNTDFKDALSRYDSLCDFVHHNLGSMAVVNAGSAVADIARSAGGGMIIMRSPGPITQYQYPVPAKAKHALKETADSFLKDAKASVQWINEIPESPYSPEEMRLYLREG
jgi:hypothetical protein